MLSPAVARILSIITVGMVFSYIRMLIVWLDRNLVDPIMKQRINAGSDRFFAEESEYEGKTEIDSLAGGHFDEI